MYPSLGIPGLHELDDRQFQPRHNEGVTVGSSRISHLLSAHDLLLLPPSEQGLQHALDRFSVACDQAGNKIITKKIEVLCLSRNPNCSMCA